MAASAIPDWVHYVKAFGQVITWLIVVIGWFIVNDHNNERETRKETRTQVDKLLKLLEYLEDLALSYHTEKCHDDMKANRIKTTIARVVKFVDRLQFVDKDLSNNLLVNIRKSITLKNFDTNQHEEMSLSSELVREIICAIDDLSDFIELEYSTKYMN